MTTDTQLVKDRLNSLIEFIIRTTQIKMKVIQDYRDQKYSFTEAGITALPGVTVYPPDSEGKTFEDEEVWINVRRCKPTSPPATDDPLLAAWMTFGDKEKFSQPPTLKQKITLRQLQNTGYDISDFVSQLQADTLAGSSIKFEDFKDCDELEEKLENFLEEHQQDPRVQRRPWDTWPFFNAEDPLQQLWVHQTPGRQPRILEKLSVSKLAEEGYEVSDVIDKDIEIDLNKEHVTLTDFPERDSVQGMFKAYLDKKWNPWLENEKAIRKSREFYDKLYLIWNELRGNLGNENLQLVLGAGILNWKYHVKEDDKLLDKQIRYPLLTQRAGIKMDTATMEINITRMADAPKLETEMFLETDLSLQVRDISQLVEERLKKDDSKISLLDPQSLRPALLDATSLLGSNSDFCGIEDNPERKPQEPRPLPVIDDTWVLMTKAQSKAQFIHDLRKFQSSATDTDISGPMLSILTEPASDRTPDDPPAYRGLYPVGARKTDRETAEDLFFPKPYNTEQVQIIQMLEQHGAVVVQGPPGTGKTHTIANLICHYLATGRSVLVTSMKETALSVIGDKLPEAIRPLAVYVKSEGADSIRQSESSISKISGELPNIDPDEYRQKVDNIQDVINKIHAKLAYTDKEINRLAKQYMANATMDGEAVLPVNAAKELEEVQLDTGFIPDPLDIDGRFAPRMTDDDINELREARLQAGENLSQLDTVYPELSKIPDAKTILQIRSNIVAAKEMDRDIASGKLLNLREGCTVDKNAFNTLISEIETFRIRKAEIESSPAQWLPGFRQSLNNPHQAGHIVKMVSAADKVLWLNKKRLDYIERPVKLPKECLNNAELRQAIETKAQGKNPWGFLGLFGKSDVKQLFNQIRVDGAAPNTDEDWKYVLQYLNFSEGSLSTLRSWDAWARELNLPQSDSDIGRIKEICENAELVHKAADHQQYLNQLNTRLSKVFSNRPLDHNSDLNAEDLDQIKNSLRIHVQKDDLLKSRNELKDYMDYLKEFHDTISAAISDIYLDLAGNASLSEEDLKLRWNSLLDDLRSMTGLYPAFQTISRVTDIIANSGAPLWAAELKTKVPAGQPDPLLPVNWSQAWRHKRLGGFMERIDSRLEMRGLTARRLQIEKDLSGAYQQAIVIRAWLNIAQKATPEVRAALEAYRNAIIKIGKGTGKTAPRYMREAKQAAETASKAIPCWIMNHSKISDTLSADYANYDLVIIDEASQSDNSAFSAILRSRKILIVGDHKQVTPIEVGIDADKNTQLIEQYLYNQVPMYKAQLGAGNSIYDLCRVVFAQHQIMLREHFRCVAPIIEFSKREFYHHRLNPLRKPHPSELLVPPLIDLYVKDGFRTRDINTPEAMVIVREIRKMSQDPRFDGRSIGVISLLNAKQAEHVMDKVISELGEEIINKYDIGFGDATAFEGNEKDVIFLSMVVDLESHQARTVDDFARKINVAASRARDRMYLVRSVTADDLSPKDIYRLELMKHFQMPFGNIKIDTRPEREKCESPFEEAIYDLLVSKGYQVRTQVHAGNYRIDMVVYGENQNTLAIECDGDSYHGPDKWEEDRFRQSVLERAGWVFWRCFASNFIRHRQSVEAELFEKLQEMGIEPGEGGEIAPAELVCCEEVTGLVDETRLAANDVQALEHDESGEEAIS